jgi:putative membrane protein
MGMACALLSNVFYSFHAAVVECAAARRRGDYMTDGTPAEPAGDGVIKDTQIFLAAERTFLAWIRTGLTLMGFGFVVARFSLFLRELEVMRTGAPVPTGGASLWMGLLLVLGGVALNLLATGHYLRMLRELRKGDYEPGRPAKLAVAIAVLLAIAGLTMVAYLAHRGAR